MTSAPDPTQTAPSPAGAGADSPCRPYHHGDLRRGLLSAAREVIVERGVPGTSLREIARRAGVSPRAPYHHFDDKLSLLAEVAREGFDRMDSMMAEAMAIADPRARLTELGMTYLRFAAENPGEFQTMHWDELCSRENFPDRAEKAECSFHYLLQTLSEIAQEPLEEADLAELGLLAWAAVHGLANLRAEGVLEAKDDQYGAETALRRLVERNTEQIVTQLRCEC